MAGVRKAVCRAVCALTGITSMEGKFKFGDEGLVTFASVNMIEELADSYFEQSAQLTSMILVRECADFAGREPCGND